jgi:hypothetical protein
MVAQKAEATALGKHGGFFLRRAILEVEDEVSGYAVTAGNLG